MFMGASASAGVVLPAIGASFEGGYYAGSISQNADGVATHALIVAPAASGYNGKTRLQFKTTQTATAGTTSVYDGAANTANMSDANHPAANYCAGLSIGGYTDWYLPARFEIEIAYYYLKPTTSTNNTSYGANSYAVPARASNYTSGDPAQTSVTAFQKSTNTEYFDNDDHWTSTAATDFHAYKFDFSNGQSPQPVKTNNLYVRAFRKIAL